MSEAPAGPANKPEVGTLWRHSLAVQRERDTGFDGMLLFVALNRVFSPLLVGYVLFRYLQGLSRFNVWQAFTDSEYAADRQWVLVGVCGSISCSVELLFDLVLLWLFFLRRRAFRTAIIVFLLLGIAWPAFRLAVSLLYGSLDLESLFYAGLAAIWASFWIPYFVYSERVKNTFVR
jgi:hypothetical protein